MPLGGTGRQTVGAQHACALPSGGCRVKETASGGVVRGVHELAQCLVENSGRTCRQDSNTN